MATFRLLLSGANFRYYTRTKILDEVLGECQETSFSVGAALMPDSYTAQLAGPPLSAADQLTRTD